MAESFVSRKDRIIASAIEIISESGLASLSTKSLTAKENISEELLYKYFGGIDEVLVEVVEQFVRFDNSIQKTIQGKDIPNIDKIREFFNTYATYYDHYFEITAIVLNYEALLHNVDTRQLISDCIISRNEFLQNLIEQALETEEILAVYTPEELRCLLIGIIDSIIINRRVMYHERSFQEEVMVSIEKTLSLIKAS